MKRAIRRGLVLGFVAATAAACGENGVGTTQQAAVVSTDLVISQVYGGGGNSNAVYTNDFVELVNIGTSTLQMSNYSVQYAGAASDFSSTNASYYVDLPSFSLAPGQYFLVALAASNDGGTANPLPTPDATGTINMSATAGKVALTMQTNKLDGCGNTTPCLAANWVDLVGYGNSTSQYEGAGAAPGTSNSTGDLRTACTDTGDNSADFTKVTPVAHNSASTFLSCVVDGGTADAGDGGIIVVDGGTVDSGTDSGVVDSGTTDSGVVDSGTADAGPADSGVTDSGASDASASDASASDGGGKDGGIVFDSGTTQDSGAKDSGTAKDAGKDAGTQGGGGGGCSCDVRGGGNAPPWAGFGWALGLVALVRSRRRKR
jgi:MYXO-CTERM domain-containing protein